MPFENALYARDIEYILSDYVFSIIAIALAMEFTRRTTGWFMPILITLSLSHILFLGRYIEKAAFPTEPRNGHVPELLHQ